MTAPDSGTNLREVTKGTKAKRRSETSQAEWPVGERREYFIEFSHSLLEQERRELLNVYNLTLERYYPSFTYLESVDWSTLKALRAHPLVTHTYPFEPGDNVPADIGTTSFRTERRKGTEGRLLRATVFPDADLDQVESDLKQLGGVTTRRLDNGSLPSVVQIELDESDPAMIDEMAAIDGIYWIEEVPEAISDSGTHADLLETGIPNAAPFASQGLRGLDQIIGIIDEDSLDLGHCWFGDPTRPAPNPTDANHRKVVAIYDRQVHQNQIGRHATFVAGILAGDHAPHAGASAVRGIAYDAKLVYGNRNDFQDSGASATLYDYLENVALNGGNPTLQAYIISNSWHLASNPPYFEDSAAVDRFMWTHEDRLVIGSTGNTGDDMGPPGTAKNALCVGAAYVNRSRSCFADGRPGPTADGQRRKPDLLAPGCDTESAGISTAAVPCNIAADATVFGGAVNNLALIPISAYCRTSYATPVVAAAAAIVRQYFVEGRHPTGHKQASNVAMPSAALLKAALLNATEKPSRSASTAYPTDAEGWGILRLNRILRLPGGSRKIQIWDVRNDSGRGLFTTQSATHKVNLKSNRKQLKVTLVWTDAPGQSGVSNPVVNDLDLIVKGSNGATYLGNHFVNGFSAPGGNADTQNNVEMVLVPQPTIGTWEITVKARQVNVGNLGQGYALVVRGDFA